jgi:hypothetical protein
LDSDDRDERALGVWILRELGPIGTEGRRPFSDRVVPRLRDLLARESDPRMERLLLQALAFNGAWEALPEFLARVAHPDDGVRETVAFQLPYVVGPAGAGEEVADAVLSLASDPDPDIRYYALHAVVEEGVDIGIERRERLLGLLLDDPDEQVRSLARAGAAPGGQDDPTDDRLPLGERVYVELAWSDGVRAGVADVHGEPHYFAAVNDYTRGDEADGKYLVWPLPPDVLTLEREQWAIFAAWNRRYERSEVSVDLHPGRGGIDPHYDELSALLTPLRRPPAGARTFRAEWHWHPSAGERYGDSGPHYTVTWHRPTAEK